MVTWLAVVILGSFGWYPIRYPMDVHDVTLQLNPFVELDEVTVPHLIIGKDELTANDFLGVNQVSSASGTPFSTVGPIYMTLVGKGRGGGQ